VNKIIEIETIETVKKLEAEVVTTMSKAIERLKTFISMSEPNAVFYKLKFETIGFDPLNEKWELNLVEQINQSFTYLASFKATEVLLAACAENAPFRLNLGTTAGSDIESLNGMVAAEVFASVTPTNNQKLNKDIKKVISTNAPIKYSFFMCPGYEPGRHNELEHSGVIVWALDPMTGL